MSQDVYSAYDADVNRRIQHAETRIKYWVIGGVLANLLALVGLGAPLVYYLGTLNAQTTSAITTVATVNTNLSKMDDKLRELEFRQRSVMTYLKGKGFEPPVTDMQR